MTRLRKDRPGYQGRKRSDGSTAHYWNPQRAVKGAPKSLGVRPIDAAATEAQIVELCQRWTDELRADLRDLGAQQAYDGTIASLVREYRADELSPYQSLKRSTRQRDYDPSLQTIVETVGERLIDELTGDDFRRWNRKWGSEGRVHRGHNAIRKLRAVMSYGVEKGYPECRNAREILSLIRFEAPAPRKVMLEWEHAVAVVEKAMEKGRYSIALTQALQWDTALRRIDIIGEWVPAAKGDGGIVRGGTRWQGPSVSVISSDLILTIEATSKTGARSSHDLTHCPLTMMVLAQYDLPKIGPLIVSEQTGVPYRENYYAQAWREIAREAGVPDSIWSMDTRAGAISEAESVGGIEAARKLATHSNVKTTLRYVRSDVLESNRTTAMARQKLRS
ncbi:site-specific integrase [Aurantimonas sp. DM33-3]|uniref:site-specific integrase n=1 Tax=Aurantimonas sp. DM33-3 TaxID=2766955 RepID=UPI001652B131|nr:site-specific integrase [Aurantimonas sp. DM33-3]MBC6714717.1 site-specific integrase [Aurantimonas sp. DM33-3]